MSAEASAADVRAALRDRYGERVRLSESFGELTAEVAPELWPELTAFARDRLGMTFFDWLTGVDEPPDRSRSWRTLRRGRPPAAAAAHRGRPGRARLATLTGVYRGADWHERETYEMFGVVFDGHPDLRPLLLPDGFEGHPLRKDFVLAARVAKPWPGAKEPGESGRDTPRRRRLLPPGVPPDLGRAGGPDVDPGRWCPGRRPARSGAPVRSRRLRGPVTGVSGDRRRVCLTGPRRGRANPCVTAVRPAVDR